MLNLGLKSKVMHLEQSIAKTQEYQHLQQEQVTELIDLVETQAILIGQLQTDMHSLQLDRENWKTLFQILQTRKEIRL